MPVSSVKSQDLLKIYQSGKSIYSTGVDLMKKIKGEFWHEWTRCEYKSGFTIYNRFKSKRLRNGGKEIIDYYTKGGDNDSWYGACDGNEKHVSLPRDRANIEKIHGPIKQIVVISDPPSCKRSNTITYIDRFDPKKKVTIRCR
jgi:hypothetical protein